MTTAPTPCLSDLDTAVADLTGRDHLYRRLRTLIPQQTTILESHIGSRTRYSAAPIPWNTPAAMLYLDIHAAAREHETNLTLLLWNRAKYRGPGDNLTAQAIERLPNLINAAITAGQGTRTIVTEAAHDLTAWPTLIRRLLDEARSSETPWTKAPGNLRCTGCGHALYLAPGWQYDAEHADVICRTCRDTDGQHLRWKPSLWLGRLQATTTEDPDELITIERAKTENPDARRNTLAVWAWRAVNVPASAPFTPQGTTARGVPLFRRGDIGDALARMLAS